MKRGYKIFGSDWACRGKQYRCPGRFKESVRPKAHERGMHFCESLAASCRGHRLGPDCKVAEVIAHGEVDTARGVSSTDDLEIVREVPWEEVLRLANPGWGCTGLYNTGAKNSGNSNSCSCNSGDWNTSCCNRGDRNSGDFNIGDGNSGRWNTGDSNSGNSNSGDFNSGSCNSGSYNSGGRNLGDCNSGDFNSASFSSGCFNTREQKIHMFDKPSEWTFMDWRRSRAWLALQRIPASGTEWVESGDMTDEEKAAHPEHETTGGYLRVRISESADAWWRGLGEEDRDAILGLPNFDKGIFKEVTGIDVDDGGPGAGGILI